MKIEGIEKALKSKYVTITDDDEIIVREDAPKDVREPIEAFLENKRKLRAKK